MEVESLPYEFYVRHPLDVARELLGQVLVREDAAGICSGLIVETEAYHGYQDPASHAYRGRTRRNAVMFGPAGFAYVYQIYGSYFCINAVCGNEHEPAAVLIRAVEPLDGIPLMQTRRKLEHVTHKRELTSGPGRLCQAFGISLTDNGTDLVSGAIRIVHRHVEAYRFVAPGEDIDNTSSDTVIPVRTGPRIGITRGLELNWRFWIARNPYVSPPRV